MDWLTITFTQIAGITLSSIALYFVIMILVRINGLRSFSKMSAHDFAVTVAVGSILATTVLSDEPSILQGSLAIFVLLLTQALYSRWRLKRQKLKLENSPLMLMEGSTILYGNLKKAKITEDDLIAKLREANVLSLDEVKSAVFEATGDVSILHGEKDLDKKLLKGVRR